MSWIYNISIIAGLVLVIGIPLHIWESRTRKKKIEAAVAGREPLTDHDFYESYFRSKGVPKDVVSKVRQILEEELGADLSRLRAEDDFSENLKFFWEYDSLADVELILRIEQEFRIRIENEEARQMQTVEDIVSLVWRKAEEDV